MRDSGTATSIVRPAENDRAEAIQRRLRAAGNITLRKISCEWHDGLVILRGRTPTYYAKQLAQSLLLTEPDVLAIENDIEVARRA